MLRRGCRLRRTAEFEIAQRRLLRHSRSNGVWVVWQKVIRDAVLSRFRDDGATGSAQAAADFLSHYGWDEGTWANRSSQIKKGFASCDKDGRPPVGAKEGNVISYIGYLNLEGRVGPTSVTQ